MEQDSTDGISMAIDKAFNTICRWIFHGIELNYKINSATNMRKVN
ncbi:MAG TPA: hypothetical protein VFG46_09040 [Chryseolinea sp.]|nr:hypothetical protein [Chryseolinea sp.]